MADIKLKVFERLENGNYDYYTFHNGSWWKEEIIGYNKLDNEAIEIMDFISYHLKRKEYQIIQNLIFFMDVKNTYKY